MRQLEASFSSTMSLPSSTLNCNSKNLCMPILRLVILIHSECNWYFRIIISYVESPVGYQWQGVTYACCMFVASVLGVLCMHHSFNMSYTTGMRIRTALSSAIYRKVSPLFYFLFIHHFYSTWWRHRRCFFHQLAQNSQLSVKLWTSCLLIHKNYRTPRCTSILCGQYTYFCISYASLYTPPVKHSVFPVNILCFCI